MIITTPKFAFMTSEGPSKRAFAHIDAHTIFVFSVPMYEDRLHARVPKCIGGYGFDFTFKSDRGRALEYSAEVANPL